MLSELLAALGPFFGCQSGPRLAETLLFVLIAFGVGFCCGGLVVGLVISAKCRFLTSRLLCFLLEGPDRPVFSRPETGRATDRLERYRA